MVFAAHEILFDTPETFGEFGLVVIDEAFWQAGLKGINPEISVEIAGLDITLGALSGARGRRALRRAHADSARDDRVPARRAQERAGRLRAARAIGGGRLAAAGENKDGESRHAIHLEWARKVDTGIRPGVDVKAMQAAARKYGPFLGKMSARAAMWHELDALLRSGEEATGRLELETVAGRRFLRILQRREVDKELLALPIVVADATLPLEIARYFLPDLTTRLRHRDRGAAPEHRPGDRDAGRQAVDPAAQAERATTRRRRRGAGDGQAAEAGRSGAAVAAGPAQAGDHLSGHREGLRRVAETAHWNAFEGQQRVGGRSTAWW